MRRVGRRHRHWLLIDAACSVERHRHLLLAFAGDAACLGDGIGIATGLMRRVLVNGIFGLGSV